MAYEDLKMRLANIAVNFVGNLISTRSTDGRDQKEKEVNEKYYRRALEIAKKYGDENNLPQIVTIPVNQEITQETPDREAEDDTPRGFDIDLMDEKIEEGISCLPCSRDHLGVASSVLKEAARFAKREKGMRDPEVIERLHAALEELNALERIDLAPKNLVELQGKEKELADWALNTSADLRHKITAAKTPEDVDQVSAQASEASKKLMAEILDMTTEESMTEKLCGQFEGKKKEECLKLIDPVLPKV